MKNLFAYGTLMSERVLLLVSGHCFSWQFGILKGYGRRSVTGQNYPAIIPEKESFVDGILYWDIPDSAWKSLDRYEGEMYERYPVSVELNNRAVLSAETYVALPSYRKQLDKSDWSFENFVNNYEKNYIETIETD